MFTGLIQEVGWLNQVMPQAAGGSRMIIAGQQRLGGLALGASVACQGICLTVIDCGHERQHGWFAVDLSPETLACSTAATWQIGQKINLETSLKAGDELGGHFVSGHVDAVGSIVAMEALGENLLMRFGFPELLAGLIARKGSVAVNGVSLTVNEVDDAQRSFAVNLVPHTLRHTDLGSRAVGDKVNLEADMMARYAARALAALMAERSNKKERP